MKRRPFIPSAARPDETSSRPLDWAVTHGAVEEVFQRVDAKLRRRRRRRMAAATVCLGLMLGAGATWHRLASRPEGVPVARSEPGTLVTAPRRQYLADGSVADLRENARIAVDFSEAVRHVVLERGEAVFHVAKNTRRPFIVSAGSVDVRAVGTAFAVDRRAQSVGVLVTEGRVAVEVAAPGASGAAAPRVLCAHVAAGQRTDVALGTAPGPAAVAAVSQTEIDERLDWLVPRMQLAGTPLAQVVEFANQHAATRVVIVDPRLREIELSGVIRTDSTEPLLRLLETEFGVEVSRRGDVIELRRGR